MVVKCNLDHAYVGAEDGAGVGRPILIRRSVLKRADKKLSERVTNRELAIFQLLGKGCDPRPVAQMMTVSMKTVQAHCAHIKEKLKLTNAAELLREAVRWQENYPNN